MNGHWDVTETKEFLDLYGPGRGALKRLFSIPSNTQGYTCFEAWCASESYEMQLYYTKLMKVMKEGIYIGQNTTILCFVFGDHVYFEIPVRWQR
jgi:hypothetical protein